LLKFYFNRVKGLAYIRQLRRHASSRLTAGRTTHAGWIVSSTLPDKIGTLVLQIRCWRTPLKNKKEGKNSPNYVNQIEPGHMN
jgi:hypothetical protein